MRQSRASPLLETSVDSARGILLNFMGAQDNLPMMEINEAAMTVHEVANPDAEIIFGVGVDETLGDTIIVTIIATRFGEEEATPAKKEIPATKFLPPNQSYNQPSQEPKPYNRTEQPKREEEPTLNNSFKNIIPDFMSNRRRK